MEKKQIKLATGAQLWRLNELNLLSSLANGSPISSAEAYRLLAQAKASGLWKT
jgi:hypothetical protein